LGKDVAIRYEPGSNNFDRIPAIRPEWLSRLDDNSDGVLGEYFNNPHFEGIPVQARTDRKLDFFWFSEGPTGSGKFSVRWTGKLTVPETGRYVITFNNTATCRFYLDDELVIENKAGEQTVFNPSLASQYIQLEARRSYSIRVEYTKDTEDWFANVTFMGAYLPLPEEDNRFSRALEAARACNAAIVFAGMPETGETEGEDRKTLDLPGGQAELIRAVAQVNPRTIVVINAGSPVSMPWLDQVPAVIMSYFAGLEAGNAIASILTGDVNPSGKLPVTFPRRLEDTPAFENYPGGRDVCYGEGIFVGYRHYDLKDIDPLFPFGHGLSYSDFAYNDLKVPAIINARETWRVSITVKNTGKRAGKEVVQLYIHDEKCSVQRPRKELKGFTKINLQPDEEREVEFELNDRSLAFYDPVASEWVVEPGEFEVMVGRSSRDIQAHAKISVIMS
jgi:beta-glucosidase